jgi:RNA polymerase sigma factor (sigma-70 family)
MPEYSEQAIIEGCQNNKQLFQELLYKKYYNLFLKLCIRYTNDLQNAEQALHDGFIKIFKSIHTYENKGSFEGWMRKIIVNACLDHIKSKHGKYNNNTRYPENIQDSTHEAFSINFNAIDTMSLKEILNTIQTLPIMSRTVFNLYVFEGMKHKEIAQTLAITEGTSQWHVNNARKLLQEKLKNHH